MATDKQIAANQANAKKSTGPKTDEGKSVASKNALKHGALSSVAGAEHEDQALYDTILAALIDDHNPQTTIERQLVERLTLLFWREIRLAKFEAFEPKAHQKYVANNQDARDHQGYRCAPDPDPTEYRALENILPIEKQILVGRYQTTLSNQISQTLKELRAEQKLREQVIEIAPKVTRIEK